MSDSFLFYDLETFGQDPRRTRIAQFAAIRTDADLQQVEEPVSFFVQPARDLLPAPGATLVTGITPQQALREGLPEAEAFARIQEEMARPGTCSVGYNSLRFDDEFVRFGLYRNFHDPYEREWRGGNSRWDLLDVLRFAHALRPDGIAWRAREDGGGTSFRLEHLAADNDVREGAAHEALSDVRALIGIARRLRTAQPRLWDYALRLRDKRFAGSLLDVAGVRPLLHVSQRFPAAQLCAAAVAPLAWHPAIDNRVIVFDLAGDVDALLALDADAIAARVFTAQAALPEGVARLPLKEVHLNRCPALFEWRHLRDADFVRLGIDPGQVEYAAMRLHSAGPALVEKLRQVYARPPARDPVDVDGALYDGFIGDGDRRLFAQVRATPPSLLGRSDFPFRDPRLPELLFRYRARNWPQHLSFPEHERWNAYRRQRLRQPGLAEQTLAQFDEEIAALRGQHAGSDDVLRLLDALQAWRDEVVGEIE